MWLWFGKAWQGSQEALGVPEPAQVQEQGCQRVHSKRSPVAGSATGINLLNFDELIGRSYVMSHNFIHPTHGGCVQRLKILETPSLFTKKKSYLYEGITLK